nr:unnamed protein product [Callosobruchus analis]
MLLNWKKSHLQQTSIDKKDFPHLLAFALIEMDSSNNVSQQFQQEEILKKKLSLVPGRSVTASIDEDSSDSYVDKPLTNDNSDADLLEDASDGVGGDI